MTEAWTIADKLRPNLCGSITSFPCHRTLSSRSEATQRLMTAPTWNMREPGPARRKSRTSTFDSTSRTPGIRGNAAMGGACDHGRFAPAG